MNVSLAPKACPRCGYIGALGIGDHRWFVCLTHGAHAHHRDCAAERSDEVVCCGCGVPAPPDWDVPELLRRFGVDDAYVCDACRLLIHSTDPVLFVPLGERLGGSCPVCCSSDGYINYGTFQYAFCRRHRLYWFAGEGVADTWDNDETDEYQERRWQFTFAGFVDADDPSNEEHISRTRRRHAQ